MAAPAESALRELQGWGAGPETGSGRGRWQRGHQGGGGKARQPREATCVGPGFKAKMEKEQQEKGEKGVLVVQEVRGQGPRPGWPVESSDRARPRVLMCDLEQHRPGLSHSQLGGRAKDVTWGVWAGGVEEELVSGSKREQGVRALCKLLSQPCYPAPPGGQYENDIKIKAGNQHCPLPRSGIAGNPI